VASLTLPAPDYVPAYYWVKEDEHWQAADAVDVNLWRWMGEAACRSLEIDPEVFFLGDAETTDNREMLERICHGCPVRQTCLDHALLNGEHGWWGGTSRRQRRRMLRECDG
jgi:WhiB family transcriptional regulator, redox-sensing transcriptional regulator